MGSSYKSQIFDLAYLRFLCHICLLIVVCSTLGLHQRLLHIFVGFILMDYASCLNFLKLNKDMIYGVLMFRPFSLVLYFLKLVLMFCFGLMVLQSCSHFNGFLQFMSDLGRKTNHFRHGVCSKLGLCVATDSMWWSCGPKKSLGLSSATNKENNLLVSEDTKAMNISTLEGDNDDENIDDEFDVIKLRKMVKMERQKVNEVLAELEKERMAAASATEEAMAMIMKLQGEKSSLGIQANQFKRFAEQKLQYNQEVIQSLRQMVMKQDYLLRLYRQKLGEHLEEDEMDYPEEIFEAGSEKYAY